MSAPSTERRGGISKAASANAPHIVILRLIKRLALLADLRPSWVDASLSVPEAVEKQMQSKERIEGDGFSVMQTITEGRMEAMHDSRNRLVTDRDGAPRMTWVEGPRERVEPLSAHGGYVRMIATRLGLGRKSLHAWTEDEAMRIAYECTKMIDKQVDVSAKARARADEFLFYPSGWREAYETTKTHARNAGWTKDESE